MSETNDFAGADESTSASSEHRSTADVDDFLASVALHLRAIPIVERDEMIEEVRDHILESQRQDPEAFASQLRRPAEFARELLAAAGRLESEPSDLGDASSRTGHEAGQGLPGLGRLVALSLRRGKERLVTSRPARFAVEAYAAASARPYFDKGRRTVKDLLPLWWVVRAYLAVTLIAKLAGGALSLRPRLSGSADLGALGVLIAIVISVRLARRPLPGFGRLMLRGVSGVLLLFGVVFWFHFESLLLPAGSNGGIATQLVTQTPVSANPCAMNASGQVIGNLYPYDSTGQLLSGVILYDQTGHPVDNLCPDQTSYNGQPVQTKYSQDVNGAQVANVFPRTQTYQKQNPDGTTGSVVPVPPPAVVIPRLASPDSVTTTSTTPTAGSTSTTLTAPMNSSTTTPPPSTQAGVSNAVSSAVTTTTAPTAPSVSAPAVATRSGQSR